METIHIALPSDQNYIPGLLVTAGSIAYHASRDVALMIHVLDGGIHDDTFEDMACKVKRLHPHVSFHRIPVNDELFRSYPSWSGNKMTYARLMLPEALPEVSHIIYSDTDFLWLIDIAELWRQRSDDVIFMSVKDLDLTIGREAQWAESHGMRFVPERYFCAGLSFYNLDKFRKEGIIGKVAGFLCAHPDVKFADQTAMYYILGDRARLLPHKWQTFSTELTAERAQAPVAIHYGGDHPWMRWKYWSKPISDSTLLWEVMLKIILRGGEGVIRLKPTHYKC